MEEASGAVLAEKRRTCDERRLHIPTAPVVPPQEQLRCVPTAASP